VACRDGEIRTVLCAGRVERRPISSSATTLAVQIRCADRPLSIPALFKTQRNHSLPSAGLRREPLITSIAGRFDHSSHGFDVERGFAHFGAQSENLCIHGGALLVRQNIFF
jgi:hypothetical protein